MPEAKKYKKQEFNTKLLQTTVIGALDLDFLQKILKTSFGCGTLIF